MTKLKSKEITKPNRQKSNEVGEPFGSFPDFYSLAPFSAHFRISRVFSGL